MKHKLIEGEDFYYSELGYMVLTAKFHLKKGVCCGNGCRHCPYNYKKVPEPKRSELRAEKIKAE
jgi:Family of unknown function (DUF5522)